MKRTEYIEKINYFLRECNEDMLLLIYKFIQRIVLAKRCRKSEKKNG